MNPLQPLTLPALPARHPDTHKGTYGTVLAVAGSRRYPGAAILTALGAGRAGAGLVQLALPAELMPVVVPAVPFATVLACPQTDAGETAPAAAPLILEQAAGRADAVVLGPGLGEAHELVATLLAELDRPVVLDADGLNAVAAGGEAGLDLLAARTAPTVLTPHPGEFARLTGAPRPGPGARSPAAAELARRTGSVVVLKGHRTVVTDGHRACIEEAGNPGMATGGMGDVLSGVLGALLAVVRGPAEAAALAVHLHALAGDLAAQELGEDAVLPEDVAARLGRVMRGYRQRPVGY